VQCFLSTLGDIGQLIPALGDAWTHCCSTQVMLDFYNTNTDPTKKNTNKRVVRSLKITKSPFAKCTERAVYCITSDGVRDTVIE